MSDVTQADRDAAAKWAKLQGRQAQAANIRRGSCDTAPIVQAFANHREAIEAEIGAWLREIAAWNNKHDDGLSGMDKMAQGQLEAAEAIEGGEYRSKSDG